MQWLDVVEIEVRPGQYSGAEVTVGGVGCNNVAILNPKSTPSKIWKFLYEDESLPPIILSILFLCNVKMFGVIYFFN